jgi:MoxR-like ATPase
VHVSDEVKGYIIDLVRAARVDPDVLSGISTRAGVCLFKIRGLLRILRVGILCCLMMLSGCVSCVAHRIRVKPEAEMDDVTAKTVVDRVLSTVPVPR